MTTASNHECSICGADYSDDEGGVQGSIGILPVSFCPFCLNGVLDMAQQLLDREEAWSEDEVHQSA